MQKTLYHGTNNKRAPSIVQYRFNPSVGLKHYLGDGAYFYDNYGQANEWARKKFHFDYTVIECRIDVDRKFVLDLTSKYGEDAFKSYAKNYIDLIESHRYIFESDEFKYSKLDYTVALRSVLFNIIAKEKNFKMIVALVDVETNNPVIHVLRSLNLRAKAERQYNIIDQSIIIEKRVYQKETIV